ncbi:MAG: helix-turn-helix domain-containing protein [Pseudonocardiaceae bacterium]
MGDQPSGRDELSRTLRELRQAAQLSTRETATLTGFSAAKISRVERGINIPTEMDVATLASAYRAPAQTRSHLTSIARDIQPEHRPVVMARAQGQPSAFQKRLNRIEATTEHLTTFTPTVVPGLLQTEVYMRALVAYRELPPAEVDKFVTARLARQQRLANTAHRFTQITTEGALGWRAGTPEDMAEQINHIAVTTRLPNVRVGIVPWGTRAHVFPLHGWDLHDQRAVIYGTADATAILTEPRDVARYVQLTEAVEQIALWDDEASAVLERIADEYRTRGHDDKER